MQTQARELLESLIYLDRDFVAGAYEALKGHAPASQISRSQGGSAGAKLPIFSAGLTATETRTFNVSTLGMLTELLSDFQGYPEHKVPPVGETAPSRIGWIQGELSVFKVVVRSNSKSHDQIKKPMSPIRSFDPEKGSETYFALRTPGGGLQVALITTPDYFSSGVGSLIKLYETVLEQVSIPVRALVRIYDASSSFKEWIGVPLVMYEQADPSAAGDEG